MASQQQQPPLPSIFNPQVAPNKTGPGLPPSPHVLPPSATRPAMRPSYPQHPAPAPGLMTILFFQLCQATLIWCSDIYLRPFPGFLPHQPFQPQSVPMGGPSAFPPPGPSMPAANLSGPPLQPSSPITGGMPPMPSPGVPPTSFMPSTSLPSGPMPPSSQPGAPVPMYPGGLHNQGPAPPMASGPYAPLGSGYPQGGPGAPAVKPFGASTVAPPPTGRYHVGHVIVERARLHVVISHLSRNLCLIIFMNHESYSSVPLIWLAGYFPWLNTQCEHQGDRVRVME